MRQSTSAKKKSSESAHSQMTTYEINARISIALRWRPDESAPKKRKNLESGNTWGTRPQAIGTGHRQDPEAAATTSNHRGHKGAQRTQKEQVTNHGPLALLVAFDSRLFALIRG